MRCDASRDKRRSDVTGQKPVQYGDLGDGRGGAHGSERTYTYVCVCVCGRTATASTLSLYLACLSEFHDRGSHPQICCDHDEAPSPARRGKREAGLAPCHHLATTVDLVFEAGDGCKGRASPRCQVPCCRFGSWCADQQDSGLDHAAPLQHPTIHSLFNLGTGVLRPPRGPLKGGSLHID